MGVKEEYRRLKDRWLATRGSERERADRELKAFLESIVTNEDKELLTQAVEEHIGSVNGLITETKELRQRIEVREMLLEVMPFISVSAFAKAYFGKSSSWMYQRINGNEVHGKPATFTDEEIRTLSEALQSVSGKLNAVASKLTPSAL